MDQQRLDKILAMLPDQRVAVVGDLCVDRYLDIDPDIVDRSNETELPIHQVTQVRSEPGAAANVVQNLASLGVGEVYPVGFVGTDGEGYELGRAFESLGIKCDFLRRSGTRPTGVYVKPLVVRPGRAPEELNRFDIFARAPLAEEEEEQLLSDVRAAYESTDAMIVADYGETGKYGIVTARVRQLVGELARGKLEKPVLADSRVYIDKFRNVLIKPNRFEAMTLLGGELDGEASMVRLMEIGQRTAERNKRPVLITLGADGVLLCAPGRAQKVPAYPSEQEGEIDVVGAGDAVLASVAAGLSVGCSLGEAAVLGMVAASITVQQVGRCGGATPEQIRARFAQYAAKYPDVVGA